MIWLVGQLLSDPNMEADMLLAAYGATLEAVCIAAVAHDMEAVTVKLEDSSCGPAGPTCR